MTTERLRRFEPYTFRQIEKFMIKVINEVREYTYDETQDNIKIVSHWNSPDKIVLVIGSDERVFYAKDLIAAIENARNTARY